MMAAAQSALETDKTPLGFNRWKLGDKPHMEQFNADNARVDELIAELREELGKKADIQQPQIYELKLAANIGPYLDRTSFYFKDSFGIVTVTANLASDETIEYGTLLAELPEGFRPKDTFEYPCTTFWTTAGVGIVGVHTNGRIVAGRGDARRGMFIHISFPTA